MLLPRSRNHSSFVNPDNAETSEMLLLIRFNVFSSVNSDNVEISEMLLSLRDRLFSCGNPDNAETSEMLLPERDRNLRFGNLDVDCVAIAAADTELLVMFSSRRLGNLGSADTSERRETDKLRSLLSLASTEKSDTQSPRRYNLCR